jgi:hypothetical protein
MNVIFYYYDASNLKIVEFSFNENCLTDMEEPEKYKKKQNRLFYWTLVTFFIFLISLIVSEFRQFFGFDPHWAGDNFGFNFLFLFPMTIICVSILFFTGGLTIGYWKTFPSLPKKIVTIILSYGVIIFVSYVFLSALKRH